jgi:hypothetical protein
MYPTLSAAANKNYCQVQIYCTYERQPLVEQIA